MNTSNFIQGLSLVTALLSAGTPVYGASLSLTTPETQLDEDAILDIEANPGEVIGFTGVVDTSGLPAPLQSITIPAFREQDEVVALDVVRSEDDLEFFPDLSFETTFDPETNLLTAAALREGPGLPPDTTIEIADAFITLGSQLNNDGEVDYGVDVTSAIDVNGTDVTELFAPQSLQQFEVQSVEARSVPEPSAVVGLSLFLGIGSLRRKQQKTKAG